MKSRLAPVGSLVALTLFVGCVPKQSAIPAISAKHPAPSASGAPVGTESTGSSGSTDPGAGANSGSISTSASPAPLTPAVSPLRANYAEGEVASLCAKYLAQAQTELDAIANAPSAARTVDNTLLAFETTLANLSDAVAPLNFMGYVSTNEKTNTEGSDCNASYSKLVSKTNSRKDLYDALGSLKASDLDQQRLLAKTLELFRKNGLERPAADQAQIADLRASLIQMETDFNTNLNKDTSSVSFTATELTGAPQAFLDRLAKTPDGLKLVVTTKKPDVDQVLRNVPNADTRKAMLLAYWNRAGDANTKLLSDAVKARARIASLTNYLSWMGLQVSDRMAQTTKNVGAFLTEITDKITPKGKADLARLLKFKQETVPTATALDSWDIDYYSYQLKKRDYALDDEEIRKYFPADGVVRGVFEIYSKLLGVTFTEVQGTEVWAEGVKLYRVNDTSDDRLIGYFYTDFIPRPGKYGHAAAFPLVSPRSLGANGYAKPVSAIVANFTPPAGGKPSLLAHDEVRTFFHEFGHIMHNTLSRAPYASLAGTNVAMDFVEAPSQMLENWVYDPGVLAILSDHLPKDLLDRIIAARDFNEGYTYTRQCLLATFDMNLHTSDGTTDPTVTFDKLFTQFLGIPALPGAHFAASFGHLMSGYDAGYYGYLWSEARAADMFTVFADKGLLDPATGALYRKTILESGNMKDPNDLLKSFLGRDSTNAAFLKRLGI